MSELGALARVRSKNAGPFWITIDIFCEAETYGTVAATPTGVFAARLGVAELKRFDLPDLRAIKLSLPRPQVQGAAADRDMHGAGLAHALTGMQIGPARG
ncbi:DUF4387 family protein [Jannaschia pohangensis]|uniref:DUF4387 domain-containing protein n=1 Tax=Jannaschia pohangensis TaxID=390807 RepID=A0A1I3J529_9RHOB|nr:DUF4387 family protein [Jannaschia pohangensis]SFI55015.1 protein of unknown function [Jannaschia pohangensis]